MNTNFLPPSLRDSPLSSEGTPIISLSTRSQELKVAVIREEFVSLTKDPLIAVVLNQLVYWAQRVKDFDLFLEEERELNPDCNVSPRHGWIYKTAQELTDETMLHISHPTMRKYLKFLIEQEWLEERINPINKWNKTTQYRVNLRKLQEDLFTLGYALPGFPLPLMKNTQDSEKSEVLPNVKNLHSDVRNLHSNERNLHSNVKNLHSYTYTETTSKTTNREHTQRARDFLSINDSKSDFSEKMLSLIHI